MFIDFNMLRSKSAVQLCVFCASHHYIDRYELKNRVYFGQGGEERKKILTKFCYTIVTILQASVVWAGDSPDGKEAWVLHLGVLRMHVNAPFTNRLRFSNFACSVCLSSVHYLFDFLKSDQREWKKLVPGVIIVLMNTPFHLVLSSRHFLKHTYETNKKWSMS